MPVQASSGIFLSHLEPYFKKLGCKCVSPYNDSVDASLVCVASKIKYKNIIQRLDGIYVDKDIDYIRRNSPIRKTYSYAKGVIFQSKFSKDVIFRNFGKQKNYTVIHNGTVIQEKEDGFLKNKYPKLVEKINKYQTKIICVAKWRESKRLDSCITGFMKFAENKNACLLIMGQSPNVSLPDNIIRVGSVPNSHIPQFYYLSDVCLNLSYMDACPNAVVESLAHGTPCVVTNLQGVTEVMNENHGVILQTDKWNFDPVSFKAAIKQLKPDMVSNAIHKCLEIGRFPPRDDLHIRHVASKYYEFINKVKNENIV